MWCGAGGGAAVTSRGTVVSTWGRDRDETKGGTTPLAAYGGRPSRTPTYDQLLRLAPEPNA